MRLQFTFFLQICVRVCACVLLLFRVLRKPSSPSLLGSRTIAGCEKCPLFRFLLPCSVFCFFSVVKELVGW